MTSAAQALPSLPLYPPPPDTSPLRSRPGLRDEAGARSQPPKGRRLERGLLATFVFAAHAGGLLGLVTLGTTTRPPEITPIQIALIPAEPQVAPVAAPQPPEPVPEPRVEPQPVPPPPKVERVEPPPKPKTPPRKPTPVKPAPPEPVSTSPSALTDPAPPPAAEPAPPAAPATPAPAPVSAAPAPVTAARFDAAYLNNPTPTYPMLSRRMREEGQVMLRVLVSADGLPARIELRTSSGSERLDNAAQEAVTRWRFVPARRGDEAIEAWVLVPIVFKLQGN